MAEEEKTRQLTPEEQADYLQGQLAGLGALCGAIIKQLMPSPIDQRKLGTLLATIRSGESEKGSPAFNSGFENMSQFVAEILSGRL